jgi:beta-lactamase regulating signal transducer with metallopeptidase domain
MTSLVESLLLSAAIKGSLILTLAAVAAVSLRRASAATRHLVWTLALGGVFLAPFLGAALPPVSVPIAFDALGDPSARKESQYTLTGTRSVRVHQVPDSPAELPANTTSQQESAMPASEPGVDGLATIAAAATSLGSADVRTALVGLWAVGAAILVIHFLVGLSNAARLVRRTRPVDDDRLQNLLEGALERMGLRRGVVLLVSSETAVPITCGIRRPVIVLPADAFTWSEERANVVLLHEAGHIRRQDCLVQHLAQITRALHWFNPLTWIAAARLTAERERACDDLVLAAGTRSSAYAEHLLEIARSVRTRQVPVAALAMARPSELEGRLLAILDAARNRRLPTRRCLLTVMGVATVGIAGIAAVRMEPRVEARAHPIPADVTHVVAQGLPTPTPTPTPSAAPTPTPTPAPAPPGRIHSIRAAERQPTQGKQEFSHGDDDNDGNDADSRVDAAARDAIAKALIAALKDEDAEVRRSAMTSLMRVRSPLALEPLMAALRDSDAEIREHAAFALGQLHDERAVPALTAALQDESADVREKAAFALGQVGAESAAGALAQALKDSSPSIRSQAAFALGQIRSVAAVPGLLEALKDTDADVRKQAAFALGQIGDPGAIDALTAALKDVDTEVRRTVAFALGQVTR